MTNTIPHIGHIKDAVEIARYIIQVAHNEIVDVPERGDSIHADITHLKLQKMLYFAQAAHLAAHGTPLFSDQIEAWKLGPVVPRVYDEMRRFTSSHIPVEEGREGDVQTMELLKKVWQTFGKYSSIELVKLSHKIGPWERFYKEGKNVVIPNHAIEKDFKEIFDFTNVQPVTTT